MKVLHARKREVTEHEVERQRLAYRQLAEKLPDGVVVDASRQADEVAAEVVDLVLDRLVRRTASRFRLDERAQTTPSVGAGTAPAGSSPDS